MVNARPIQTAFVVSTGDLKQALGPTDTNACDQQSLVGSKAQQHTNHSECPALNPGLGMLLSVFSIFFREGGGGGSVSKCSATAVAERHAHCPSSRGVVSALSHARSVSPYNNNDSIDRRSEEE